MTLKPVIAAVIALSAVSCSKGPEAPSAAENRQLDEAGALLDDAQGQLERIDDGELAAASNKETAEPDISSPAANISENRGF